MRYSEEDKAKAKTMAEQGATIRGVATAMGCSPRTAHLWFKIWNIDRKLYTSQEIEERERALLEDLLKHAKTYSNVTYDFGTAMVVSETEAVDVNLIKERLK